MTKEIPLDFIMSYKNSFDYWLTQQTRDYYRNSFANGIFYYWFHDNECFAVWHEDSPKILIKPEILKELKELYETK